MNLPIRFRFFHLLSKSLRWPRLLINLMLNVRRQLRLLLDTGAGQRGVKNSPQLPKVKDWENQGMSIPKKWEYRRVCNMYTYICTVYICPMYIYIEPLEFALIGDTRSQKKKKKRRPVRSFPFRGPPWSWWPEGKSHDFYPIHPYFFSMNHYDSPRLSMVNIMSMIHKNVD